MLNYISETVEQTLEAKGEFKFAEAQTLPVTIHNDDLLGELEAVGIVVAVPFDDDHALTVLALRKSHLALGHAATISCIAGTATGRFRGREQLVPFEHQTPLDHASGLCDLVLLPLDRLIESAVVVGDKLLWDAIDVHDLPPLATVLAFLDEHFRFQPYEAEVDAEEVVEGFVEAVLDYVGVEEPSAGANTTH